jgi:hypothetical protein
MHPQAAEPKPIPTATNPEAITEADERLITARLFVDAARIIGREYFPEWQFGNRLETLFVGLCVAIGHLEGKPFSVSKLSAHHAPRTALLPQRRAPQWAQRDGRSHCHRASDQAGGSEIAGLTARA